jgi:hypothetical protein
MKGSNSMKPLFTLLASLAFLSLATLSRAQDEMPPVPLPGNAANMDITGTWSYSTFDHRISGRCPAGQPMAGTLIIGQKENSLDVFIQSGAVCNPVSMCSYTGAIIDGNVVVSNTDTVDDEGGSATNAMRLYFFSETSGGGQVSSRYVHPEGFECHWSHYMKLSRPSDKEEKPASNK